MAQQRGGASTLQRFPGRRPEAVRVSSAELVSGSYLDAGRFPRVLRPAPGGGLDPVGWAGSGRELIGRELLSHGAVLLRGFGLRSAEEFARFASALSPQLIEYCERSSPRTQLGRGVYTSTDYPSHQPIRMHNEQSYTLRWPLKIMFCCLRPAPRGGHTPIADSRKILKRLSPRLVERFTRKGVMYVRNYNGGIGLTWQEAFQTTERSAVEAHCRGAGIEWEWRGGGRLRTSQVRPAVRTHPQTGEPVWFNHVHFFNVSSLEAPVREAMLSVVKEADLPFHTFYGDGTPVEPSVLDEVGEAYERESTSFPWEQGDVLLLDNMLSAHGRDPFEPPRLVVTAMAEPFLAPEAS